MHFVCLCPTHGRPSLVANALRLFLDQDLWDGDTAHFAVFDDANQIASQMQTEIFGYPASASKSYGVASSDVWIPLPHKYNHLLQWHWLPMPGPSYKWSTGIVRDPDVVYVVWDDDDVYLPWHLTAISAALRRNPAACWAHPGIVWSTYDDRPERRIPTHEAPRQESAAGRFHGALAIRGDTLFDLGGWPDTELATYDQQMLAKLKPLPQADTAQDVTPSYCYRWADTGKWHCSGSIDEAGQYKRPPIQEPGRVETLTPRYDYSTQLILRWLTNRQIQVTQKDLS